MKLPEFLEKAINNNTTSLGEHPAFPPEDEDLFISSIMKTMYGTVMDGIETDDRKKLQARVDELVTECKKEESGCVEALEKLCNDMLIKIFQIPDDTIEISLKMVTECDMSMYRMVPESTPDFEFEDIDEMKQMSDMIYQRRMINCLMSGISEYYSSQFDSYMQEIWKINPKLMGLYSEISKYNKALLYNTQDTIKSIERSRSGCVKVIVGDEDDKIKVIAEGVIFPVLLEYAVRGILEIASMKGLPDDDVKAEYIMGKTDYRLAENWDMRLGIPLWRLFMANVDNNQFDLHEIGCNFIVMELSKLEPNVFNGYLQNVFKKTKKGLNMTTDLLKTIEYNKGADDFNNYVKVNNNMYAINDADEYTSAELLAEMETFHNKL